VSVESELAEARQEADAIVIEGLRQELRQWKARARESIRRATEAANQLAEFEALTETTLDVPAFTRLPAKGDHHGIVCAVLTDTHYGEVVDPREIHRTNAYNPRIAERRTERFFQHFVSLAKDYHRGITYDGAVLFLGGDMFSGDIHDELTETNAETTHESLLHFLDPIERGIKMLADELGSVVVAGVVGNHPRRTHKPRAKRRAVDNADWALYSHIQRDLRPDERIKVFVPRGPDIHVPIHRTVYCLHHGDAYRGGSGIAGGATALALGHFRRTSLAQSMGRPFDWEVLGHRHTYDVSTRRRQIESGSLKGFDEYANTGVMEFAVPQLAWWISTPEKGPTFHAAIEPMDRRAEGW